MNLNNADRAEILVKALPYIQEYTGKIVVVKYGGNAMTDGILKDCVMRDIVLLRLVGVKVVLVHGGGPEISDLLKRVGKESKFVNGLRVTDKETVEIAQMVLAGKVNKDLVNLIQCLGGSAIGLCGIDGHLIKATLKDPELGFVGEITEINPKPILDLLDVGYIPVISTVGGDETGVVYNINADTAAAKIAAALKAESLISLTNTPGILRDPKDESSLIRRITLKSAEELKADGTITGGMIPKVDCCTDAIKDGVKKVFVIDGRVPHSILMETLTDEGLGTMFRQ